MQIFVFHLSPTLLLLLLLSPLFIRAALLCFFTLPLVYPSLLSSDFDPTSSLARVTSVSDL